MHGRFSRSRETMSTIAGSDVSAELFGVLDVSGLPVQLLVLLTVRPEGIVFGPGMKQGHEGSLETKVRTPEHGATVSEGRVLCSPAHEPGIEPAYLVPQSARHHARPSGRRHLALGLALPMGNLMLRPRGGPGIGSLSSFLGEPYIGVEGVDHPIVSQGQRTMKRLGCEQEDVWSVEDGEIPLPCHRRRLVPRTRNREGLGPVVTYVDGEAQFFDLG